MADFTDPDPDPGPADKESAVTVGPEPPRVTVATETAVTREATSAPEDVSTTTMSPDLICG
jgi:hypothetical protein